MTTELLRRFFPDQAKLRRGPAAKFFGNALYDPQNWITTRRSTSRAVAIGLFWTWLPVPGVTAVAVINACLLRANIPISAALVWINNPLTFAPMALFTYLTGTTLLGADGADTSIFSADWQFSRSWLTQTLSSIWRPLLAGALFLASVSALIGFVGSELFWRCRAWIRRRSNSN